MNKPSGTVLVTGAGGFVGSAVVRGLVQALRRPTARPTFADGQPVAHVVALLRPDAADSRLADLAPGPDWSVLRADLGSPTAAATLAAVRPRAVLHLALDARCHDAASATEQRALVEPPLRLLFELLRGVEGAHIVSTGSAAVLSPGMALDESAPTAPNPGYLHYARAKLIEEALIEQLGTSTGVRWTQLRLFYLFGRHEAPPRLMPYLVRTLARGEPAHLSAGTQVRDYTDVDDVATAYLRALAAPGALGSRCYHIGSGRGMTVREFAATVAEVAGRPELLRYGTGPAAEAEGSVIVADPGRADRELGWRAADPFMRLKQAAAWTLARDRAIPHPLPAQHAAHEE
jgi:nucleoside-diphosphate-sugar epimerase